MPWKKDYPRPLCADQMGIDTTDILKWKLSLASQAPRNSGGHALQVEIARSKSSTTLMEGFAR